MVNCEPFRAAVGLSYPAAYYCVKLPAAGLRADQGSAAGGPVWAGVVLQGFYYLGDGGGR